MESKSELDRINLNNVMRLMPANPWQFDVDFDENAFDKLKDVMRIVAATSQEKWPSDDEWRGIIPDWVRSKMPELSKEETDRLLVTTPPEQWDSLPWDFLSWLDALRDRGWQWWGYNKNDSMATIVLHISTFPERIDAFRELLKAAGIRILAERYAEI